MVRLGLWNHRVGVGGNEFATFAKQVRDHGMGAMELLAMDMRRMGLYIARTLSFKECTFDIVNVNMSSEFEKTYDLSVAMWNQVKISIKKALAMKTKSIELAKKYTKLGFELPGESNFINETEEWDSDGNEILSAKSLKKRNRRLKECLRKLSMLWRVYWSSHQRFFRYLCVSAKVKKTVSLAKNALKEGKCVVVGLQSTGEAQTIKALNENGTLDTFISAPKAVLRSFLMSHFPVAIRPTAVNFKSLKKDENNFVTCPNNHFVSIVKNEEYWGRTCSKCEEIRKGSVYYRCDSCANVYCDKCCISKNSNLRTTRSGRTIQSTSPEQSKQVEDNVDEDNNDDDDDGSSYVLFTRTQHSNTHK